nr:nonstructural protein [Flumine parvovirus 16]
METKTQVSFKTEDRQWDGRFNVQTDEDLAGLLAAIEQHWDSGRLKYILVGGVEVGTRPFQDDYKIKHVHVAAIFHDRISKASIIKNWRVKQGNGYYLVPRNRDLPYAGWRNHHIKEFSKVDPTKGLLFERGELPQDLKRKRVDPSEEEKKLKLDDILKEMRNMYEKEIDDEEVFKRFPKYTLMYGEKLKSTMKQRRITACHEGNPHLWVSGYPGTGKTALLSFVYPKMFKKNLYNKYFDLYDPREHTHVMLEDLDHEAVEKLSINFIKTICDEAGFAIDQKYKTPQLARTTVLVSSNFQIKELVPEGAGYDQNLTAICRRFWQIKIYEILRLLQLKLVPKEDRARLKKEGNNDMSKLFMDYDYMTDSPTGKDIKTPFEYQQIIRDYFFALTG